jgi:hypothetical protein
MAGNKRINVGPIASLEIKKKRRTVRGIKIRGMGKYRKQLARARHSL